MRKAARGIAAYVFLLVPTAHAQDALPSDLETLRKNVRFAGTDHQIVRQWLEAQLQAIPDNVDPVSQEYATALKGFLDACTKLRNKPDNSAEFRQEFVSVAVGLGSDLLKSPQTPLHRAVPLAEVLVDFNDAACVPAFLAGLESPFQGVRGLSVIGLLQGQADVTANANQKKQVIDALEAMGAKETNSVVRRKVYEALFALQGRIGTALPSLLKVWDGRIQQARQGAWATGYDDEAILQILLKERTNLDSTQTSQIVTRIAPLLRIWVSRLQQEGSQLPFDEAEAIRRALVTAEELLEAVAGNAGGIRAAIDQGGQNAPKRIGDAVIAWIGNETQTGILNRAPWNVAPGAP